MHYGGRSTPLDLSHNQLRDHHADTFQGFTNLQLLNFQWNNISALSSGGFHGLF